MNADELMVGDWAILKGQPIHIESDWNLIDVKMMENCLEPIRITQDLLKANGFKHFSQGNYYLDIPECWRWKECEIWINVERESVCITRKDKTHDVSWSGEGMHLNGVVYVHELQHALNLFQIDMDIKLN